MFTFTLRQIYDLNLRIKSIGNQEVKNQVIHTTENFVEMYLYVNPSRHVFEPTHIALDLDTVCHVLTYAPDYQIKPTTNVYWLHTKAFYMRQSVNFWLEPRLSVEQLQKRLLDHLLLES